MHFFARCRRCALPSWFGQSSVRGQVRVFEPYLQYLELSLTQQFPASVNFKR